MAAGIAANAKCQRERCVNTQELTALLACLRAESLESEWMSA